MFNLQSTEPEVKAHFVRLLGGTSTVTKDGASAGGYDITATRTNTGAYKLKWGTNPGVFQGWAPGLGAATPAALAGHTLVRDTYDVTNRELEFVLYDATFAAHDLAALEYIDVVVYFKG